MSTNSSQVSFGPASTVATGGGRGPVAVNSSGTVVVVMLTDTQLVYTVGFCDPSTNKVQFGNPILPVYTWAKTAVSSFDVSMQSDGTQVVVVFQIGGERLSTLLHYGYA